MKNKSYQPFLTALTAAFYVIFAIVCSIAVSAANAPGITGTYNGRSAADVTTAAGGTTAAVTGAKDTTANQGNDTTASGGVGATDAVGGTTAMNETNAGTPSAGADGMVTDTASNSMTVWGVIAAVLIVLAIILLIVAFIPKREENP